MNQVKPQTQTAVWDIFDWKIKSELEVYVTLVTKQLNLCQKISVSSINLIMLFNVYIFLCRSINLVNEVFCLFVWTKSSIPEGLQHNGASMAMVVSGALISIGH